MQNDPGFRFESQGKKKVIVGHDLKHISDGGMNSTPKDLMGLFPTKITVEPTIHPYFNIQKIKT